MPRKAEHLSLTELKRMRAKAEKDPAFSAVRADGKEPGLTAQARRGRVEFKYRFTSPITGQRRTVTIGTFGDLTLDPARDKAAEYRRQVALGLDPHEVKAQEERSSLTVKEGVKLYLDDLKERAETGAGKRGKRSGYASAKRLLERNILPRFGSKRVLDVTSEQVRRWHRSMKSKSQANRTLTALSAVFGLLDRRELVPAGTNPARHIERHREDGQRRALTAGELQALGEALHRAERDGSVQVTDSKGKARKVGVPASAVLTVRLLALTGMRASEILGHGSKARRNGREGLRWSDIDLDRGLVHLADSKTGRQTRVLGSAAVELLRAAKPADAEPGWCICPGGLAKDRPLVGLGKPRAALWRVAGIEATAAGRADLHSLRHSYATVGAHLAGGRYVGAVSALLGHGYAAKSITQRYITSDPLALKPAADAIAAEIARLLGLGKPAKVLKHRARR